MLTNETRISKKKNCVLFTVTVQGEAEGPLTRKWRESDWDSAWQTVGPSFSKFVEWDRVWKSV
jgi:hypothetical protein